MCWWKLLWMKEMMKQAQNLTYCLHCCCCCCWQSWLWWWQQPVHWKQLLHSMHVTRDEHVGQWHAAWRVHEAQSNAHGIATKAIVVVHHRFQLVLPTCVPVPPMSALVPPIHVAVTRASWMVHRHRFGRRQPMTIVVDRHHQQQQQRQPYRHSLYATTLDRASDVVESSRARCATCRALQHPRRHRSTNLQHTLCTRRHTSKS
mmetsp:Transcript_12535/g.21156  ORF Transcript_12535/g.21156 Transcript_12535/m.21156 type:complete len:203 (-) Transcript_12535:3953-4561(-)